MKNIILSLALYVIAICGCSPAGPKKDVSKYLPPDELDLKLAAPINTWDEAIPLGNGLMGGLLWGNNNQINLSLDRGDLWDLRTPEIYKKSDWNYASIKKWVAEGSQNKLVQYFDTPYVAIKYPTKIPAGRLELKLTPKADVKTFSVNLASAVGRADLADGTRIEVFYSAAEPVAMMRFPANLVEDWQLAAPASVKQLGYKDPVKGNADGTKWFVQEGTLGLSYGVAASTRQIGDSMLMALTVFSSSDGPDALVQSRRRLTKALQAGFDPMLKPHKDYWQNFWSRSRLTVPDKDILRHYYLVQYFYGAASRRGAPPIPLQGVWTADAGSLPPWNGDYHHDLNTQMTYTAYQTAGRFDEGACFLDFMYDLLPRFREFAKEFYDAPGAAVPGVMALDGSPLAGWSMYSLSATNAGWIGNLFYLHWRYTTDQADLQRAYTWCSEIAECILYLLKPDENGILKLPLSSAPEFHNNSLAAWLTPNSNYDLDCMAVLFSNLAEMANAQGDSRAAAKWQKAKDALGPLATVPETDALMLSPDEKVNESHRHLSQSMSIHPFGLLHIDGTDRDRRIINAAMKDYDRFGTSAWCGYSFSWMACMRARVGDAESALRNLDIYTKAFILRNGFHVNGDQTKSGFSNSTYRPFTLEGNFLAAQAVHEMLLQSWSPTPGKRDTEVVRIFPAMPWRWHDAEFSELRTEGGHSVSAERQNNATTWLRVVAGKNGIVRIRDNFNGRLPKWSNGNIRKVGENYEINLNKGQAVEATFAKPAAIPAKPGDLAEPVVIATPLGI